MFDLIAHRLSFAIRFVDHFSGAPVADELPVRIDGSFRRPCDGPDGAGRRRQADGSYRFLSLPLGTHRVLWRDPFRRTQAGWARWAPDPEVTLPATDPAMPVDAELWPAASARAPASATGVRGKVVGANAAGLTVRIARQGQPFDRFTQSDAAGEFLFLPPGRLAADAVGVVPMTIELRDPDGTPRAVAGWQAGAGAPVTPGANFTLTPRRVSRILFQLA